MKTYLCPSSLAAVKQIDEARDSVWSKLMALLRRASLRRVQSEGL